MSDWYESGEKELIEGCSDWTDVKQEDVRKVYDYFLNVVCILDYDTLKEVFFYWQEDAPDDEE